MPDTITFGVGRSVTMEFVAAPSEQIRDALERQWQVLAAAASEVDLDAPSWIDGWRNREVVAHLSLQPVLLRRFLNTASAEHATVDLATNLAGTHALAELINESAREGAERGRVDLAAAVNDALPQLRAADLTATIVTMQGPILLVDYLVTHCVEAVVHGRDLVEPVGPDVDAQAIAADALLEALSARAPHLLRQAGRLPPDVWIDIATGRRPTSGKLAGAVPVMS